MTSRAREPALASQWTIGAINGRRLERNRKFVDSPLEGGGFELPVRGSGEAGCRPFFLGRLLRTGQRTGRPAAVQLTDSACLQADASEVSFAAARFTAGGAHGIARGSGARPRICPTG